MVDKVSESRLREIVSDEISRHSLGHIIGSDKPKESGGFAKYSRHPLFMAAVGFVLTVIVGGMLEEQLEKAKREREKIAMGVAEAILLETQAQAALQTLMELANERAVRVRLLRTAIIRNAASLDDRKAEYDQVFIDWNTKLRPLLFEVRRTLVEDGQDLSAMHAYEILIDKYVNYSWTAAFPQSDHCVTYGYDLAKGNTPLQGCESPDAWSKTVKLEAQRAVKCVTALVADGVRIARSGRIRTVAELRGETSKENAETIGAGLDAACAKRV